MSEPVVMMAGMPRTPLDPSQQARHAELAGDWLQRRGYAG